MKNFFLTFAAFLLELLPKKWVSDSVMALILNNLNMYIMKDCLYYMVVCFCYS